MTKRTHFLDPDLIGARAIYLAVALQGYETHGPRTEAAARRYREHAVELVELLANREIRAGLSEMCAQYPVAAELYKNALMADHLRRNRSFHFPELEELLSRVAPKSD